MREEQQAVAEFVRTHELEAQAPVRLLDLVLELGSNRKAEASWSGALGLHSA